LADNVQLNSGSGGAIAASDDIAGVQYQRVKLVLGADGVNDGDVSSANPIPADISITPVATSSSTTPLAGAATWTSDEFTTDSGNGLLVFVIADQSGTVYLDEKVSGGSYTVTAQSAIVANSPLAEMHVTHADTWRIRVVNGATPQGSFQVKVSQIPTGIPWVTKIDPNMNGVSQSGTWTVYGGYEDDVTTPSADAVYALPAVVATSAPSKTNGAVSSLSLDLFGNLRIVADAQAAPTLSNVAYSSSSTTVVASNTNRNGCIIYNDTDRDLYIKFGTTASTSSFTYKIPSYSHWEMVGTAVYTGQIDGIWASGGSGNARVTDMSHN
jgi:hypothetical protein